MALALTQQSETVLLEQLLVDSFLGMDFPRVHYPCDQDGDTVDDNPLRARPQPYEDPANPGFWACAQPNGIAVEWFDATYEPSKNMKAWPPAQQMTGRRVYVRLGFPCLVSVDMVAKQISAAAPVLDATYDATTGAQITNQYVLQLEQVRTLNNPRQDSERGTVATFVFRAKPARN